VLGGLLSAYELSGHDSLYLEKAVDLAERLMPVFGTHNGLPMTMINLGLKQGIPETHHNGWVSTAEVATLQLEFKYLGHLTGDQKYWNAVEKVMGVVREARMENGLASIFIKSAFPSVGMRQVLIFWSFSPADGKFALSDIRLGSRADSYYEYLL